MKCLRIVLAVLMSLLLSACAGQSKPPVPTASGKLSVTGTPTPSVAEATTLQTSTPMPASTRMPSPSAVPDPEDFVCTGGHAEVALAEELMMAVFGVDRETVSGLYDISPYCVAFLGELPVLRFAVFDMDADGQDEVMINVPGPEAGDGFRYADGKISVWYFGIRTMGYIKTDGTFHWSGGAGRWGIGTVRFTQDGEERVGVASVDDSRDSLYTIGGEPATEAEFEAFMKEHDAKQEIDWFDLTEEHVRNYIAAPPERTQR